jgi:hypothetical protein
VSKVARVAAAALLACLVASPARAQSPPSPQEPSLRLYAAATAAAEASLRLHEAERRALPRR